jgi:hypothetical protein
VAVAHDLVDWSALHRGTKGRVSSGRPRLRRAQPLNHHTAQHLEQWKHLIGLACPKVGKPKKDQEMGPLGRRAISHRTWRKCGDLGLPSGRARKNSFAVTHEERRAIGAIVGASRLGSPPRRLPARLVSLVMKRRLSLAYLKGDEHWAQV